jgi:two-component system response regulator FixJ
VEATKIGAADFLEKPFEDEHLLGSVRSALDRSQQNATRDSKLAEVEARLATLTNREREVLEGLAAGKPNKIIAFDLAISPRTVEIYART